VEDSRIGPESACRHRLWRIVFSQDVAAFRAVRTNSGFRISIADEIKRINEERRPHGFIRKVPGHADDQRQKTGRAWAGLKDGTDDVRESPAIKDD